MKTGAETNSLALLRQQLGREFMAGCAAGSFPRSCCLTDLFLLALLF
jgi:hypothetical protein